MRKLLFLLLPVLAFSGCNDEYYESSIPDYEVYLNLTYTSYSQLQTSGSYKTFTSKSGTYATNTKLGYGGLIIFRDFDGHIRCCDMACPYCYEQKHGCYCVTMNSSLLATCNNCKSVYDLQWGLCVPTEGPSKEKLKIYHCTDNGSSIIASF